MTINVIILVPEIIVVDLRDVEFEGPGAACDLYVTFYLVEGVFGEFALLHATSEVASC